MFSKKKKEPKLDLDDEEDFDEELDEEEDLGNEDSDAKSSQEEIEKNFIFEVEDGCPICGGMVRGNDHYRYFCKDCNVLFSKKDIISEDTHFLNKDEPSVVRKRRITSDEKTELDKKRKLLKDKVYDNFSEKKREEMKLAAEERAEEKEEESLDASEPVPVSDKYVEEGSGDGEEILSSGRSEAHVTDINDIIAALGSDVRDAEIVSEEKKNTTADEDTDSAEEEIDAPPSSKLSSPSSGLEPGRIIASTQSKKLHEGSCHFVKKIQKDKRAYFNTVDEGTAEGYEPCVCLRRMIAKENARR